MCVHPRPSSVDHPDRLLASRCQSLGRSSSDRRTGTFPRIPLARGPVRGLRSHSTHNHGARRGLALVHNRESPRIRDTSYLPSLVPSVSVHRQVKSDYMPHTGHDRRHQCRLRSKRHSNQSRNHRTDRKRLPSQASPFVPSVSVHPRPRRVQCYSTHLTVNIPMPDRLTRHRGVGDGRPRIQKRDHSFTARAHHIMRCGTGTGSGWACPPLAHVEDGIRDRAVQHRNPPTPSRSSESTLGGTGDPPWRSE